MVGGIFGGTGIVPDLHVLEDSHQYYLLIDQVGLGEHNRHDHQHQAQQGLAYQQSVVEHALTGVMASQQDAHSNYGNHKHHHENDGLVAPVPFQFLPEVATTVVAVLVVEEADLLFAFFAAQLGEVEFVFHGEKFLPDVTEQTCLVVLGVALAGVHKPRVACEANATACGEVLFSIVDDEGGGVFFYSGRYTPHGLLTQKQSILPYALSLSYPLLKYPHASQPQTCRIHNLQSRFDQLIINYLHSLKSQFYQLQQYSNLFPFICLTLNNFQILQSAILFNRCLIFQAQNIGRVRCSGLKVSRLIKIKSPSRATPLSNYNVEKSKYKLYLPRYMDFKLDNVIEVLFSSDNKRRTEAEHFVDQIPLQTFDQGIQAFLITMNHENAQVATMAALLLKKKYLEPEEMSKKLTNEKLQYIVKSVQGCMKPEKPVMFLKRCCDILVKVYNQVNQEKQLINLIQAMSASETHGMKMALYYMIEIICECSFDDKLLMQNSGSLQAMFQKGLMDENNQVKVAAFKTLTIFLSSIEDEKLVKKFEAVLQVLITKAIELIKYDQQSGVTALESMNELIEAHPKFIKPIISQLLSIFTEIMETQSLLTNLRTTSMFGILMICVNHPAVVRKSEYFKTNMVPAYMRMLSEIGGMSMEQWSQELNDEIISKNDISLSTEQHIGHILPELTNKFMLPIFIPYIQQYLASSQIQHQHAGLVAMAILTEDCHQSFKSNLKNIIELILPLMKTNNPRVMHDILMAMGYMSEEFAPEIQQNYGSMMLEFIIACLQYPALKVQFKAIQCLQNFEKGLMDHREVNVMEKYLPQIMQEIARIFEYSVVKMNFILMENVLETITNIAEMNPFENYYTVFMPGLKKILTMIGSENQQQLMIRSKTVQTIGYLLASVKTHPQIFEPDCKQIMETMMKMSLTMDFDDQMHKAIFVVYENVATSLKQNFIMYAEHIYPLVINSANRKIQFTIISEGDVSKAEALKKTKSNYASYKLDLKVDGVKSLVLNTDHLAQKIEATNLIVQMAEDMKHNFAPFIEKTLPTVKELISYKHNKQIRSNMIETIKHMINDCTTNEQKAFVVNQTYEAVCSELANTIKTKDAIGMAAIIQVMAQMMPFMTQEMAAKMPNMMMAALSLVKSESKEIQKEYTDKDMDEALQEEMGEQMEEVEESLEYIEKIIKMANGMPAFEQLKAHFPSDYQFE